MNPLVFFGLLLKGSLFSTGGFGNLPLLHEELLHRGWATERDFAESLTLGQITPGPNGLWVISLGYLADGWRGSLLALVAISLPPLLVLLVHRFYQRVREHPAVEGFTRGLGLAVVGAFIVTVAKLLIGVGFTLESVFILMGSLALGATGRVPVFAILSLAAVVGILGR